ncbi:MAG: NAD(P)H-dependent oxidoreductase [Candidatus Pacearchaeota archaeon]
MRKILIINGHPRKDSFCYYLSRKYLEGVRSNGEDALLIDLYKLNLNYLSLDKKIFSEKEIIKIQRAIYFSDFIVFIYPIWWGSMPALLKGFFDVVFTSGFAYKYDKKGNVKQLLKGKKARIISTAGSPFLYVVLHKVLLTGSIVYPTLKFCGFSSVKSTIFHSIRKNLSKKRAEKIAKKVFYLGKRDSS